MKNFFQTRGAAISGMLLFFLIFQASIFQVYAQDVSGGPVDDRATKKTRALFHNLIRISGEGVLFGHQDDLAYGVNWKEEPGRSDIRDVCGAYPAVFGWDVSKLGQRSFNIDSVDFEKMIDWIREGYRMGGVITLSWHMDNPVTGGDSWDNTPAVHAIIPGGPKHDEYKARLDLFADFIRELKVGLWTRIPVIFRPFHEHTGSWFWWGRGNTTAVDYRILWQFTVDYLQEEKGLHNLLYAYSTDVFSSREDYLEFYPGDDYVDVIAYDDYHSIRTRETLPELGRQLREVVSLAREKGKVAALSETGLESIPIEDWFTSYLLEGIRQDPQTRGIAYVLVWRNANKKHHYGPYEGHPCSADFIRFYEDPFTLFAGDVQNLYKMPKR